MINNDYICCKDRTAASKSIDAVVSPSLDRLWSNMKDSAHTSRLLRAIQSLPIFDDIADSFKLDILLEDYLQQVSSILITN